MTLIANLRRMSFKFCFAAHLPQALLWETTKRILSTRGKSCWRKHIFHTYREETEQRSQHGKVLPAKIYQRCYPRKNTEQRSYPRKSASRVRKSSRWGRMMHFWLCLWERNQKRSWGLTERAERERKTMSSFWSPTISPTSTPREVFLCSFSSNDNSERFFCYVDSDDNSAFFSLLFR